MLRQRHFESTGLVVFLLILFLGPAHAWEFSLKGSFNWTYEWYNQTGAKGFFGQYNLDKGTATRTANLNFWNGGRFDTNFVTGSSSGWSYFNVEFEPEIKVNQAIRMRGFYRLGTWGNPAATDYITQDAPGTKNAFSEGQWTQFWLTVNTPWGVFGVGKRPWKFGTGLQYDGSDAATTESLALVVPYGPFDIGLAFYPYRFAGRSSILLTHVNRNRVGVASAYGDPYDLPHYYTGVLADVLDTPGQYYSRADRSGSFSRDFLAFVSYSSGPMQVGVLGSFGAYHIGPEAILLGDPDLNVNTSPLICLYSEFHHGTVFVKYNNGMFFMNSEAAWLYWTDRFLPTDEQVRDQHQHVEMPYTRYIEQWRAMLEMGVFAGPVKVSLITAWSPGPDRRAGRYIDRQPTAFVWHPTYDTRLGNFSVFRPYSYLFSHDYGSGLNAYNLSGDGYLRDAFVLAGRVDYAVASNLNVFGSFFWAQRTSHGYPQGVLQPNWGDGENMGNGVNGNIDFSQVCPGPLNIPGPTSVDSLGNPIGDRYWVPNIPDRALGYEINIGADWQLLEGWQFGVVFGYWSPGAWFSYACIDRSYQDWKNLTSTGTIPGRTIDPVIGGEFSMKFEF